MTLKRRANKHRPKDNSSRDGERRHSHRSADKAERDFEKYGVVAVMLDEEAGEGYEEETEEEE